MYNKPTHVVYDERVALLKKFLSSSWQRRKNITYLDHTDLELIVIFNHSLDVTLLLHAFNWHFANDGTAFSKVTRATGWDRTRASVLVGSKRRTRDVRVRGSDVGPESLASQATPPRHLTRFIIQSLCIYKHLPFIDA